MSNIVAIESGNHWYNPDGSPAYDKTLRHARKEGLLPSVTTVLKDLAKPALNSWMIEQGILSALTLPIEKGESLEDFAIRAAKDSRETSSKAAEFGTSMHSLIEQYLREETIIWGDFTPKILEYWTAVKDWLDDNILETLHIERSAVNVEHGFGGRVDLVAVMRSVENKFGEVVLIDFKTQGTKKGKKVNKYPEWCYQLAGCSMLDNYDHGVMGNLVISSTEPGRVEFVKWDKADIENGKEMFLAMCNVFRLKRKFPYDISHCNTRCDEYEPVKFMYHDVKVSIDKLEIIKSGDE